MAKQIIIYDSEYWTDEGAPKRSWNGLYDQPPLLIQIGAFKVSVEEGFPILDEFLAYSIPVGADGNEIGLTDCFVELTKITPNILKERGQSFKKTVTDFKNFSGNFYLYSYGYDMLRTIVPSCYIARVECPFDPAQARDIRQIFKRAGLTDEQLNNNSSGTLAKFFGVDLGNHHYAHDARNDAMSLVESLRALERQGRVNFEWF
ncbi:MAG: hypothetical protein KA155_00460 [Alphaproteobacteria bacterium]|jgi:DNA polymerase III epsilon subunit-like protein|nr:hypothetical protein [Alphaproteobacteria bacterium]